MASTKRAELKKLASGIEGGRHETRALFLDVVILDNAGEPRVEAMPWRDHGWIVDVHGVNAEPFAVQKRDGTRGAETRIVPAAREALATLFALAGVADVELNALGVLRVRVDGTDRETLRLTAEKARALAKTLPGHVVRGALAASAAESGAPVGVATLSATEDAKR